MADSKQKVVIFVFCVLRVAYSQAVYGKFFNLFYFLSFIASTFVVVVVIVVVVIAVVVVAVAE